MKSAIEKLSNVPMERLAQIWMRSGDTNQALQAALKAVEGATNQVHPLANYIDLLSQAGKQDEAKNCFDTLRRTASQSSLDLPILERIAPFALSLNLPEDWREPYVQNSDVGERPSLESLGPFRWRPSHASDWTLRDAGNEPVSLKDYQGKPVILVFYLGARCVHCLEQLNAFSPKSRDFKEAGISLVAISTESVPDLKTTLEKSKEGGAFPFPILSDATLETFRAYRAFDDFEATPLHGSFLVDGHGLVRWQDISYEPFSDVDFILNEAKRLLALTSGTALAEASDLNRHLSGRDSPDQP